MSQPKYIKPIIGDFSGQKVWIVQWPEGDFGWEYVSNGLTFGKDDFESINDAIKSFNGREFALSIGETVMV